MTRCPKCKMGTGFYFEQEREIENWIFEFLKLESPVILNRIHDDPSWQALKGEK